MFRLLYMPGGHRVFAGEHGHGRGGQAGGYGPQGGFGGHRQFMDSPPHEGGSFWLGLLMGLAVLVLLVFLVRCFRKKTKVSSMNEFIDTALQSSHSPAVSQNARVLDQWEKNIDSKKENE
ncbi:hypothetical protein [Bacillus sp. OV322]|uniref:hypothetical protein n=1 Tax=Bacillus sp. OV322 TaxID=1882764 RepID=UPI0015A685B2|nr:hypothetical protein [Bacillus sp. OV322]